FSARGLHPLPEQEKTGNVEKVIRVTRERYAKERRVVEDKIVRWHENDGGEDEKEKNIQNKNDRQVFTKKSEPKKEREIRVEKTEEDGEHKFEVICSRCGKRTRISFKPDGVRPVYCKECLSVLREEKRQEVELRKKKKQEEIKKIEEQENSGKESGQELSLEEIKKIRPVDFKNKQTKGEVRDGEEIKEGEEIIIKN
ncbi:MAG: hypothetical protein PHQ42_05070, partial [Patescibacteria group bacterium]|nr:hypothetical protein [Patescibacteria group bacterium]